MEKEFESYIDKAAKITAINEELAELEKKLATPERTVQDIVRHIELLKELQAID